MWEEWRAEIDRATREASLGRPGHDDVHLADFKVYRVTTLRRPGDQPREVPRSWRVRMADARVRPIL